MTKPLEAQFYFGAVIDHDDECQRVSDEEAQFWTVYERNADGLSSAICDCTHRNDAVAATERFNALIAALEQSQAQSSKWLEAYHKAVSIGARYEERIAEIEAEVKFPGVMRCNTCNFSRSHVIVTPGGVTAGESTPEHCPNGCGPLWHDTYRRQYNELYDAYKQLETSQLAVKLPDLNEHLIAILGRPNFTCSHLAELLRGSGVEIRRKSENEQAAVIHYLLNFYLEYGDKWESIVKEDIQSKVAALTASGAAQGDE